MGSKKEMGKAVKEILWAANYIWELVEHKDIGLVSSLIKAAKLICNFWNLREAREVDNFENVIIQEYLECMEEEIRRKM